MEDEPINQNYLIGCDTIEHSPTLSQNEQLQCTLACRGVGREAGWGRRGRRDSSNLSNRLYVELGCRARLGFGFYIGCHTRQLQFPHFFLLYGVNWYLWAGIEHGAGLGINAVENCPGIVPFLHIYTMAAESHQIHLDVHLNLWNAWSTMFWSVISFPDNHSGLILSRL